ncbi:hypothetical protein ABM90_31190 [Rhodococcus erythropolis]|nr:hypothetical protein ABM90_31190 [Rhodococcus erythropolis]
MGLDLRPFAPWTWGNNLLGQAFNILGNFGVGGQTTTEIRARIGDVLATNPGWVHLLCGTNNMGIPGGLAAAKSDISAMLDIYQHEGIRVVLGTIPPRITANYTGTIKADTFALNEWIITQSRDRQGVILADYFSALSDNAGNFRSLIDGFNPTTDGIHLSATGGHAAGRVFAAALAAHAPKALPYSPPSPGSNLLSNPRPAGNSTSSPIGWTIGGASSGSAAWSDTLRADGLGSWKTVAVPSGGVLTLNSNYTLDGSRLAVGDTASAYVEYQVSSLQQDSAIDAQGIAVGLKAWNGASFFETRWCFNYFRGPNAERSGAFRVPDFVIPPTTTILALFIELRGGQSFSWDRAGIYNKLRLS